MKKKGIIYNNTKSLITEDKFKDRCSKSLYTKLIIRLK